MKLEHRRGSTAHSLPSWSASGPRLGGMGLTCALCRFGGEGRILFSSSYGILNDVSLLLTQLFSVM